MKVKTVSSHRFSMKFKSISVNRRVMSDLKILCRDGGCVFK